MGRIVLPEIDSTNAEAGRRAPDLAGPTWILALRQTRGRGRRGRGWADPPGNFAASHFSRPEAPPSDLALRSFVAALALHDALVRATGQPERFTLKWPNDVLLDGGKLAGILLESLGQGTGPRHLVIGIGVNLRHAPEGDAGALRPVSLLDETGCALDPEAFLDLLAPCFAHRERQLATFGFAPIRTAWLTRAARLGERITARSMQETRTGIFEGIDTTGALLLTTEDGPKAIPAAEVYF